MGQIGHEFVLMQRASVTVENQIARYYEKQPVDIAVKIYISALLPKLDESLLHHLLLLIRIAYIQARKPKNLLPVFIVNR